jgi:hypothetical protein
MQVEVGGEARHWGILDFRIWIFDFDPNPPEFQIGI